MFWRARILGPVHWDRVQKFGFPEFVGPVRWDRPFLCMKRRKILVAISICLYIGIRLILKKYLFN